jgi:hypothetical protein
MLSNFTFNKEENSLKKFHPTTNQSAAMNFSFIILLLPFYAKY